MKTYKEYIDESRMVKYAGHDYYGSPANKVPADRSPSSAGGDAEEDGVSETKKLLDLYRKIKVDKSTKNKL